ncbi:hypothetical protein FACS1894200_13810 [Spirochaetia bacterium]|nr:hypothetical protein FACS1894200_13810 [Spirochaetia bacterium]
MWANLNNERGYYWFGTEWNLDDVYADGVTLEVDATGHMRIIIEGVAWQYLSPQVKDLIKRPFMVSATVLSATLSIKLTKDYSGLYLIETDGATVLRSSALTYDGNFFSTSSLPNIDNQYKYYVSPQTATQTFDATLVYWQYVPGLLEINTSEDSAEINHNVLSSVGLRSSAIEAKTQTIIAGGNTEINQYDGNIVLAAAQDRTPINTTSSLTVTIGAQTVVADSTFDATPVLWKRVRDTIGTFGVIKNINAGNVTVVTVQADNDKLEKWFPANPFAPLVTGYTGYHSYNTTTGGALFARIVNGAVIASFEMDGKNPLLETSTQAVSGNPIPSIIVELFGKGDAKPGTAETFEAAGLYWCDTSETTVIWHKLGGLPASPHKITPSLAIILNGLPSK